jgi:hypothetical protein
MKQNNTKQMVELPEHSNGSTKERHIIELFEIAIKEIKEKASRIEGKLIETIF